MLIFCSYSSLWLPLLTAFTLPDRFCISDGMIIFVACPSATFVIASKLFSVEYGLIGTRLRGSDGYSLRWPVCTLPDRLCLTFRLTDHLFFLRLCFQDRSLLFCLCIQNRGLLSFLLRQGSATSSHPLLSGLPLVFHALLSSAFPWHPTICAGGRIFFSSDTVDLDAPRVSCHIQRWRASLC